MNPYENNKNDAYKVSAVSIGVNSVLSVGKVLIGFLSNSGAMISDGIHSASDVLSTLVVIIGIKFSDENPDKDHEYGHERNECIASLILSIMLFLTGLFIGWNGIEIIFGISKTALVVPGVLALAAAVVSIVSKEWMYHYTMRVAKRINSSSLKADAWHHRSDAMSSVGALVGILGARMGFPILDPIASVVICLFIIKASYDIFQDSTNKLTDCACSQELEEKIKNSINEIDGVYKVDSLKTRQFGSRIYVETEVFADENLSFKKSNKIAENTHDTIEKTYPVIKHITVRIIPVEIT